MTYDIDKRAAAGAFLVDESTGLPVSFAATTIADGADVAQGATTDAAVVTNAAGTISGKLRGLVAWAYTRMPAALGQTTKAGSLPVALASDTGTLPVSVADGASVTLGAIADAAYTSGSGTNISVLKGIFARLTQAAGDAIGAALIHATGGYVFNGSTWDRQRDAATIINSSAGTGVQAVWAATRNYADNQWKATFHGVTDGAAATVAKNAVPLLYNGATIDRQRGNAESTPLASAARTTLTNSPDQTNHNGRSLKVYINVSVFTSGGLTVKYQEKEPVSGTYIDVLTATKIVAVTAVPVELQVGPHVAAAANLTANRYVARTWRVVCTPDDATSITYSVAAVTGV